MPATSGSRVIARLRGERGASVIELVVVTAMFMVLLGAVLSSLNTGTRTERGQQARRDALVELRQSMTQLTRDLRQAEAIDPSSTHMRLVMTTIVDGTSVPVTYELDHAEGELYDLVRTEDGDSYVVVDNMVIGTTANPDPPFCYSFDSTASPAVCVDGGSPPTIGLTAIRVTMAKDPEFNPGEPITLATDVQLRNA